jgi:multiple sugar transport system permease protein
MSQRRLAWLLCAPAALVMLLVAGYPIAHAIWLSLQRYDLRFPDQRGFVGLANYATVLQSGLWWRALEITFAITIVSVAIELVLGMGLAWVMHRTLVARGAVRAATLIPYGVVSVVAAFSWRFAWTPGTGYLAHLTSAAPLAGSASALAVVILAEVWKTTPFMALLLLAGLALVPEELERAATIDGAGPWQRFTRVIVPVMRPAIVVALLFRTLDAFRIFDNLFVLTGGARGTRSVSMLAYDNLIRGLNLGIGATLSVLIFVLAALLALAIVELGGTR